MSSITQNYYIRSIKFWIITSLLFFVPYLFILRNSLDQNITIDGAPNPGYFFILPLLGIFYIIGGGYWIYLLYQIIKTGIGKNLFFWKIALVFICGLGSISLIIYITYTIPSIYQTPLVYEIPGRKGCFEFYSIESGKDEICLTKTVYPYGDDNIQFARESYVGEKGTYEKRGTIYKKDGSKWSFNPFDHTTTH